MDDFWKDLSAEELHFRDILQFEVKNDLLPLKESAHSWYTQEFYFFIPNALQINEQTYTREQFYRDQTIMIRYKTPEFTFKEILDLANLKSPLARIVALKNKEPTAENKKSLKYDLKLLANIVRSALRRRIKELIQELNKTETKENSFEFSKKVSTFCTELTVLHNEFLDLEHFYMKMWNDPSVDHYFTYIDEFISSSYNFYLAGFLEYLRKYHQKISQPVDKEISFLLAKEKIHREKEYQEPRKISEHSTQSEFILYRAGLLNKFVLDALALDISKTSLQNKYGNLIGSFAAGFAMLIYLLLFIWQGQIFVITSVPFIVLTVVAYIIKDRLKESLRNFSNQKAFQIFSDYSTKIRTLDTGLVLGEMKESFSFLDEDKVAPEIENIRNKGFHAVLSEIKRPEKVIYYKNTVEMYPSDIDHDETKSGLNTIFRFNIHQFLQKASDSYDSYLAFDPENMELHKTKLPKVYHINIITKTTIAAEGSDESKVELKKIRIIIDKEGIKQIDQVS